MLSRERAPSPNCQFLGGETQGEFLLSAANDFKVYLMLGGP